MSLATAFSPSSPLALIGAGKMGGALVAGWLDNGLDPHAALVFDPQPPDESVAFLTRAGVAIAPSPQAGPQAAVIVVAVKPQIIKAVLPTLRPLIGDKTIGVSIAAGATLATLEAGLGPIGLVRAMPNTPARSGAASRRRSPMPESACRARRWSGRCSTLSARRSGSRTRR
jgi:pyrroline-5-carboxylate reductase